MNDFASELKFIDKIIQNTGVYLLNNQETQGEYAGAVWSEKCIHFPTFNPHAGGSHHLRTAGPAAWAFIRLADITGNAELLKKAEAALDWVCSRQHPDGALDEITNNEQPSRWHGNKREGSSVTLGITVHSLSEVLKSGKLDKPEYRVFIDRAAEWQLSVESPPASGNFLHSEGYPSEKVILNACSHAAETLICAAELNTNKADELREAAWRALEMIMKYQLDNGCYPYSSQNDLTISYTATVCWGIQNLTGRLMNHDLECRLAESCAKAVSFLESVINPDGSIQWERNETHGQKFRTYPMVMMLLVLMRHGSTKALHLLNYLERKMYDPKRGLLNLLDIPQGEVTQILGQDMFGEQIFEIAFNQADILDFMLEVKTLMTAGNFNRKTLGK